jgi:hypothetical protein
MTYMTFRADGPNLIERADQLSAASTKALNASEAARPRREGRTRRPWIGSIAALASERREIFAIDQSERKTELCLKFVLPLPNHSSGGGHEDEIDPPPQKHFAENESRFHRLAGADIVCDQQVDPRVGARPSAAAEVGRRPDGCQPGMGPGTGPDRQR